MISILPFLRATNNSEEQYKASSLFMKRIQNLMNENNTEFIRLKQETNTIRLIASDEVISLLNDLEKIYEDMFDISNIIIKNIPHNIIENNQNELQTNMVLIEQIAQNAITIKNKLILQMRDDLSKI